MRRSAIPLSMARLVLTSVAPLRGPIKARNRRAEANDRASMPLPASPFWMHNDALDPMNQLKRAVAAVLQRLRGLAPAAIENGVGGGDAGGGSCILASHDADENADRGSGVAPCQGANFKKSFGLAHYASRLADPVCLSGAASTGSVGESCTAERKAIVGKSVGASSRPGRGMN